MERTLAELQQKALLRRFYLAGGTGLALHLGHRRSHDLDFFSGERFDEETLLQEMQSLSGFSLAAKAPHTLHGAIAGTKISFLAYSYPVLFPFTTFLGAQVADLRDIAAMKISALASRGTKRDFVDLYAVSRRHGLEQCLAWFQRKFAQVSYSRVHVLKSLTYFEDAEKDPMPEMLTPLSWDEVKQFFTREALRLAATGSVLF